MPAAHTQEDRMIMSIVTNFFSYFSRRAKAKTPPPGYQFKPLVTQYYDPTKPGPKLVEHYLK